MIRWKVPAQLHKFGVGLKEKLDTKPAGSCQPAKCSSSYHVDYLLVVPMVPTLDVAIANVIKLSLQARGGLKDEAHRISCGASVLKLVSSYIG